MTYEEFKKEIKRISDIYGVAIEVSSERDNVTVKLGDVICVVIDKDSPYLWNTMFSSFKATSDNLRYDLFAICCELAQTPVSKREQKKKFYIKHRFLTGYNKEMYLNKNAGTDLMFLSNEYNRSLTQTKFTKDEIEQLKEHFGTDLKDFEIIEVEE